MDIHAPKLQAHRPSETEQVAGDQGTALSLALDALHVSETDGQIGSFATLPLQSSGQKLRVSRYRAERIVDLVGQPGRHSTRSRHSLGIHACLDLGRGVDGYLPALGLISSFGSA
jgi:hypothetical protein